MSPTLGTRQKSFERMDSFTELRANARILDQKVKLKQRVAILIDLERFEAVSALEPRLSRMELLDDNQELRYALAYALFQVGEHRRAEAISKN